MIECTTAEVMIIVLNTVIALPFILIEAMLCCCCNATQNTQKQFDRHVCLRKIVDMLTCAMERCTMRFTCGVVFEIVRLQPIESQK